MADLPPWRAAFPAQLEYIRQKLNLPTSGFADIVASGHDKAFMVAGAQGADLLSDLHAAVLKAMSDGTGLAQFKKDFNKAVLDGSWNGWTGEGSKAGFNWRTRVIYTTNMATSYNAGRRAQMLNPELLAALPYWQYHHDDSVLHPRPAHQAWHGLTLPPDHPFWDEHYTSNGYGCMCRVIPVSKQTYLKAIAKGRGPANAPAAGDTSGIDPGWAYAPGAGVDMSLRAAVQDKLIKYPPAISQALSAETNQYIDAHSPAKDFVLDVLAKKIKAGSSWRGFVETPAPISAAVGVDVTGYLVTVPADTVSAVSAGDLGQLADLVDGDLLLPEPDDYAHAMQILSAPDSLQSVASDAIQNVLAHKKIGQKNYVAQYQVNADPKVRALELLALALKT